jgi:hypothetical protein
VLNHHYSCPAEFAWDVEGVECRCPKYWPRKVNPTSVRAAAIKLGLELPKTDGQAYIDMITGKRQTENR